MGNVTSCDIAQLSQNLGERESHLRSQLKADKENVRRHGWDEKDEKPSCLAITDHNQKVHLKTHETCSAAILGRKGYKSGIYLFEFEWNPGQNKNVVIGLASTKAIRYSKDRVPLIGSSAHSIGWHLIERCIYHYGYKTKPYPEKVLLDTIPNSVTLVLNMSEGTLGFVGDSIDYGIAATGLKTMLGETVFVAASIDEPNDYVRVTFLGGLSRIRNMLINLEGWQGQCTLNHKKPLTFHSRTGWNVSLSNNDKTAKRTNTRPAVDASVLTNRVLEEGEMFALRCDSIEGSMRQAWLMGLITIPPEDIEFKDHMIKCRKGDKYIYNEDTISFQNVAIAPVNVDLDSLTVGDIVHVVKRNKRLHFGVNNEELVSVRLDYNMEFYGFVDVIGRTTQVSIISQNELEAETGQRRLQKERDKQKGITS